MYGGVQANNIAFDSTGYCEDSNIDLCREIGTDQPKEYCIAIKLGGVACADARFVTASSVDEALDKYSDKIGISRDLVEDVTDKRVDEVLSVKEL